ncbi:MAG: hypothetical protein ACTSRZ_16885 [Promethearchaeota archaeon]
MNNQKRKNNQSSLDSRKKNKYGKLLERLKNFAKISSIFSQTILLVVVIFIATIEIIPLIINYKYIFYPDIVVQIIVWSALIFAVIFWTQFNYLNWIGQLFTALGHAAAFFIINELILKKIEGFFAFPVINIFGWGLIICMAFGMLFNLINFLFIMPIIRIQENNTAKEWLGKIKDTIISSKKILAIGFIVSLILGIGAILVTNEFVWNLPIEIKPKDYQAEIAFWGAHNPDKYNDSVKAELNEHGAIICAYDFRYNLSNPSEKQTFINRMTLWNNSFPNVKFMIAIIAPISTFIWDGQTEEIINLSKQYLQIVDEENLTNIIGLSYDWEKPDQKDVLVEMGYNINTDRERHQRSIQLWNQFFDWMDENYPDMIMQNVNYLASSVDIFDGDNALQILNKYNIFEVPRWDEYAPMMYRGSCGGTAPYGDYPYYKPEDAPDPHYSYYMALKLHAQAVYNYYGNYDKLGVYLGITNCTAYGRDVIQFQHGEEAGKGYDALVRDALIAKSFGAPRITIFILDTVPTSQDPEEAHSMGGVFDVWGLSFLDDFNESINGVNSTKPFTIWYSPHLDDLFSVDALEYFIFDFVYQSNEFFLIPLLIFEVIAAILIEKKNEILI